MQMRLPTPKKERQTIHQEALSWINNATKNNAIDKWIYAINDENQINYDIIGLVSSKHSKLITMRIPVIHFPYGRKFKGLQYKKRVCSSELKGEIILKNIKGMDFQFPETFWMSTFQTIDFSDKNYRVGSFNLHGTGILFAEDLIDVLKADEIIEFNPDNVYSFGNFKLEKILNDATAKNSKALENLERISKKITELKFKELKDYFGDLI